MSAVDFIDIEMRQPGRAIGAVVAQVSVLARLTDGRPPSPPHSFSRAVLAPFVVGLKIASSVQAL